SPHFLISKAWDFFSGPAVLSDLKLGTFTRGPFEFLFLRLTKKCRSRILTRLI
ncbi:hypothetical protein LINPERPRIM_LOCUS12457, partial [Linum perenne]